jgi:CRP-like cAMP-binding protein
MRAGLEGALAALPLFSPLRADERVRIAERFTATRLVPGERHQLRAEAPDIVLVLDGEAAFTLGDAAPVALFAGDVIGELDVVIGRGGGGELVARTPMTLATLDRAGIEQLFADFPAVAPRWVALLARELKWRNDQLREISLAHAEGLPAPALAALLARRRRNLQRHRRSRVRHATAQLVRTLFMVPGARPSFWVLVGAIAALATARTVVAMIIRNGLQKHLFALIGSQVGHPLHVHHFNYGLLLVSTVGVLLLLPRARRGLRKLAFVFGFGLGLIVDEFALLWNLNPDYYQSSSRVAAALVLLAILQVVYFRKVYVALGRRLAAVVRR